MKQADKSGASLILGLGTYLSLTSTDKYVKFLGNDGGNREAFKI